MTLAIHNKDKVLEAVRKGTIDAGSISFPNLIDHIILTMNQDGLLELLSESFLDRRASNQSIDLHFLLALAITAKMKIHTSLSDIPFAISNAKTLAELGWNIYGKEKNLDAGLMSEGTIRNLVDNYAADEFIQYYNHYVQKQVFSHRDICPDIHILDCTILEVPLDNDNYENSSVKSDKNGPHRGYKLATLRGLTGDTGIVEEIRLGTLKTHDLTLSRDMVLESKHLKPGDILINDRGFISRELLNELKTERAVDTYIPLKTNMDAYEQAVSLAKEEGNWKSHPTRKNQEIAFAHSLRDYWQSDNPNEDVELNACVVHDKKDEEYYVFVTTDLDKTAKQIVCTYQLRPEIEEDYRQVKDFWAIEDFKSTKYHVIAFHVVMVLIGYMFFQLYTLTDEGQKYQGKTLPVAMKKYREEKDEPKDVIIYAGNYFGIFGFLEFLELYSACSREIKELLKPVLAKM